MTLYFLLKWLCANVILQTNIKLFFKWNAHSNIMVSNSPNSHVCVANIRLILSKLWHNTASMENWMLTKPSEALCSLFLIQQGLPSSLPSVFTKYNHISLVEMMHIALSCRCSFFFLLQFASVLFYLWLLFCLILFRESKRFSKEKFI